MWLTGLLAPDHKTIAGYRKDNGRAIRQVCAQIEESVARNLQQLDTADRHEPAICSRSARRPSPPKWSCQLQRRIMPSVLIDRVRTGSLSRSRIKS